MTFDEWFDSYSDLDADKHQAKDAWDAALASSGADVLMNMLILCGEEECRDVQGYPEKLRALIDGLIDAKTRLKQFEKVRKSTN